MFIILCYNLKLTCTFLFFDSSSTLSFSTGIVEEESRQSKIEEKKISKSKNLKKFSFKKNKLGPSHLDMQKLRLQLELKRQL
ncbi:hypothetical protein BpHYR1_027076 [Brachionus plicatilis]|uniref:Uncharacterized protein n=1 Tax=Brachionus plicatilis TaxID=10195 RepID=A0A3M7QYC2_BRAPC|nr:hypothetical protein BpHYR1_027076 [Brachionus plicatilis]